MDIMDIQHLISWFGAKAKIAASVVERFSVYRVHVGPFIGGTALLPEAIAIALECDRGETTT
jgi:hypothetical protein